MYGLFFPQVFASVYRESQGPRKHFILSVVYNRLHLNVHTLVTILTNKEKNVCS